MQIDIEEVGGREEEVSFSFRVYSIRDLKHRVTLQPLSHLPFLSVSLH